MCKRVIIQITQIGEIRIRIFTIFRVRRPAGMKNIKKNMQKEIGRKNIKKY